MVSQVKTTLTTDLADKSRNFDPKGLIVQTFGLTHGLWLKPERLRLAG
jgi:hypothetical protein